MNANEKKIQLTVQLKLSDYWRFSRWFLWHRSKWSLLLIILVLGILASYGLFYFGLLRNLGAIILVIGISYLCGSVGGLLGNYFRIRREFANNKGLQEPAQYTFSETEAERMAASSSGKIDWHLFHKAHETSNDFFLFLSPNQAIMLPKRCFDSELQIDALRALLRAQVGEKAKVTL